MKTTKSSVDSQYLELVLKIENEGYVDLNERTGTGTKAIFGHQLDIAMSMNEFPLITCKETWFKGIVVELLWFLGNHMQKEEYRKLPLDNVRYMLDHDVNIWVGDLYKKYNKVVAEWNVPAGDVVPTDNYHHDRFVETALESVCLDFLNTNTIEVAEGDYRPLSEQEFIHRLKTDDEFAIQWGNIGPGYGWQWRHYGADYAAYLAYGEDTDFISANRLLSLGDFGGEDQIAQVIDTLKNNPSSRRIMITAWNPAATQQMLLPPCHYGSSFFCRPLTFGERKKLFLATQTEPVVVGSEAFLDERQVPKYALQLMERQRSVDTMLGLPFNIGSYALLNCMIAVDVNMKAERLIMSLENTHIYLNHTAGIKELKEQIIGQAGNRNFAYKLPTLELNPAITSINDYQLEDIVIKGYKSLGKVAFPLSN